MTRMPHPLTRPLHRLATAALLLGLVAGPPAALTVAVGWPLPHALPTTTQLLNGLTAPLPERLVINVLAMVCWLAWGQLTLALIVEAAAQLQGRAAPRLRLAGPWQALAARLVGTLLAVVLLAPQRAGASPPPSPVVAAEMAQQAPTTTPPAPEEPRKPTDDGGCVHVVKPRETAWGIAETFGGDGRRWREVWRLNQGRLQPDGDRWTDPGLIRPGWILRLPEDFQHPSADPPPDQNPDPGPDQPQPEPAPPTTAPDPADPRGAPPTQPDDDHDDQDQDQDQDQDGGGVAAPLRLPSGSVIWASLALSTLLALEITRRRRRRHRRPTTAHTRYPPRPPERSGDRPTLRWLEALARQPSPPAADTPDPQPSDPSADPSAPELVSDRIRRQLADQPSPPHLGAIPVGQRDGQQLILDLPELGGLTLTGPGAPGVARAVITAALSGAHPDAHPVQVLLLGEELLGPVTPFRGLRGYAQLDQILHHLETEVVARTRLLERAQVATMDELHAHDPAEPAPTLLLVATGGIPAAQTERLQALLGQGRRLGITALLIGHPQPPTGAQVEVTAQATITTAEPEELADRLAGAQLFTLTKADAAAILGALAASRAQDEPSRPEDQAASPTTPSPATQPAAKPQLGPTPPERAEPPPPSHQQPAQPAPFVVPARPPGSPTPPIQVRVLGEYQITAGGTPIRSGMRRTAWELLLYFLLHPQGVTLATAVAEVWPDTRIGRESDAFWNPLTSLRRCLRTATGIADLVVIQYTDNDTYRPDPAAIDTDLWRFQTALQQAAAAPDAARAAQALQHAAEVYGGELAGGAYAWAETDRQHLRTSATDALVGLAQHHQASGDQHAAIAALAKAAEADPTAEEVTRRLMRLQADHQGIDAARRTYRRLEHSLLDLGVDPAPETEQLLQELIKQAQRRARRERDQNRRPDTRKPPDNSRRPPPRQR